MVPDQKVYWLVRSKLKSNVRSRPVAAAMLKPSARPTPSGNPATAAVITANSPNTISPMIFTSVQVTACTPPNIV